MGILAERRRAVYQSDDESALLMKARRETVHRSRLQQTLHEDCRLWLLNQPVRQLVGIVAGTGRTHLREKGSACRDRHTDGVGGLSGSNAVDDALHQSVPCPSGDAIIQAFVRQYVHPSLQQRDEDQDACAAFRVVQPVLVKCLLGTEGHFMRHPLA